MIKIIKSFFCTSDGHFNPPYFWITLLMIIVVSMVVMRILKIGGFSDTLILGVLGLVVGWCAVYNQGKKGKITDQVQDFVQKVTKEKILKKSKK